ncbi:MAG: altronate hydrolase, partial [Nitrospinota bacterium]
GSANLAETDELIGAEPYVLQNVRDLETARRFLQTIERFKTWAGWHGHTAEGNPSGGNKFRGLYNIAIKSLGAAMKRHPEVRLDYVIDYGERMSAPGYYFMNSPGNDLESIAGQVASGANMIFFVTGNGSITNFPFVPTIKIVTTTERYNLLRRDMDVNAGAYLDGTPMDELGRKMFDLTLRVASGERSVGEKAGHSQVSIWRDWSFTGPQDLEAILRVEPPSGKPLPVRPEQPPRPFTFQALETREGYRSDQIGLILPTSLCSAQVAHLIAEHLNRQDLGRERGISRFIALPHTEGCGASSGSSEEIYTRTLVGHLIHPMVACALLLEHGCEKTHNDFMAQVLDRYGIERERYGWASVQLDGGIEAVTYKAEDWFRQAIDTMTPPRPVEVSLQHLRLGITATGQVTDRVAEGLAHLTRYIVGAGGSVVVPENAPFLRSSLYVRTVLAEEKVYPTLAYGESLREPGLHIMETPTDHTMETLTGLGATGVEVMFAHIVGHPVQSHRMVPLLQGTTDEATRQRYEEDLDLVVTGSSLTPELWAVQVLEKILQVASRVYTPRLYQSGNMSFQLTRGLLGISM